MLLKFAYQDFIEDRQLKNTSKKNLTNYTTMLGEFIDYCMQNGVLKIDEITSATIKSYLFECKERGNGAATLNTKIQRIRAFMNYLVESEYLKKSPAAAVKLVKTDTKIDVFTDDHIRQMLAYYRSLRRKEHAFYAYRDYMLIVFMLGTGARRSEIIELKWSDVDFEYGSVALFGKMRRKESIPITEKLVKELRAYKMYLQQTWKEPSEYVFTKRDNTQMTENALMLIFTNLRKKMGFDEVRVSPHTFRHTYCHRLAMSGMSAFAIQKLMRHQNISVTMRYVAMWGNELREQNDKHNPLNNIDI